MNTILCVKWGDKYSDEYVEKLKKQCEKNCSVPFQFICLTDNPTQDYHIQLPTYWDHHYIPEKNFFWAWRKCYMFNDSFLPGDFFLFLDLDLIIHCDLATFFLHFKTDDQYPYIVRGYWNDIDECKKNYAKYQSPLVNSSIILWKRGQLKPIHDHIDKFAEVIFFTYPTMDNYLNHHWYDIHNEENIKLFKGFPQGTCYSYYKGNIYPNDMEKEKIRPDHVICLFNNDGEDISEVLNVRL